MLVNNGIVEIYFVKEIEIKIFDFWIVLLILRIIFCLRIVWVDVDNWIFFYL